LLRSMVCASARVAARHNAINRSFEVSVVKACPSVQDASVIALLACG
jgi:hypothetical protein